MNTLTNNVFNIEGSNSDWTNFTISTDADGSIGTGRGGVYIPGLDLCMALNLRKHNRTEAYKNPEHMAMFMNTLMLNREFECIERVLELIQSEQIHGYEHININGMTFWGYVKQNCVLQFYTDNRSVVDCFNQVLGIQTGRTMYGNRNARKSIRQRIQKLLSEITFTINWVRSHQDEHLEKFQQSTNHWMNNIADENCDLDNYGNFAIYKKSTQRSLHIYTDEPKNENDKNIYYKINPHLRRPFSFNIAASQFNV